MKNLIPNLIGPLVCLILLTACEQATRTERALTADSRGALVTNSDGLDCQEAVMFFPRDLAELQARLPAGFRAREIGGLINENAALENTGQGAVFFNVVRCEAHSLGTPQLSYSEVGIFIEAPVLQPDPGLSAARHDFYIHSFYTAPSTPFYEALRNAGVTVSEGYPELEMQSPPAQTTGALIDSQGEHFRFTAVAAPTAVDGSDVIARLWSLGADGPAMIELDWIRNVFDLGTLAECATRDSSLAAQALGPTNCPAGSSTAVLTIDQAWDGVFAVFAGAVLQ